jgi:hypothetical protein
MAFEAMLLGKPFSISYIEKADTIPVLERIGNYADCPNFDYHAIKKKTITD